MPLVKPITLTSDAPQQHNQPSRKGKKSWRKNVNVTEIQEGLEKVRDELITGGVIAEKSSEQLFTVDTIGEVAIPKKFSKSAKGLKADEIIAQRSSLPPISMRKCPGDKTTHGVLEPKRQRTSYVSHKELTRLRRVADGRYDHQVMEVAGATFDLWDVSKDLEVTQDPRFSFLEKRKTKVAPITLRQKSISLAASGKEIPAVKKPDGGYSYNPLVTDYMNRLETLGKLEVEAEKFRIAAAEAERVQQEAAARSAAEAEAAEARAELSEWDEDSTWEGFESCTEYIKFSPKRPVRKTQAQRNKTKRRKEEERKAKMAAEIKRKNEQVIKAQEIAQALAGKDSSHMVECVREDNIEGDDLEMRRKKLGKIALPEQDLELVLPDELQESLRLLKPEGNLLKDRYRNLLVRGKLESRRPINFAKKARRRATEKWTHKDFVLQ